MVVKTNSKNNQKFWACSGYPNCKNTKPYTEEAEKTQPEPSMAQIGVTQGIGKVEHIFQNVYEFGPANNRHKVYYWTLEELKEKVKQIEDAGFLIETQKI